MAFVWSGERGVLGPFCSVLPESSPDHLVRVGPLLVSKPTPLGNHMREVVNTK